MTVDVGFDVLKREDGTLRVRTSGMGRRGRPEIELSDVLPAQFDVATELLGRVIQSVAERPLVPGQPMWLADDVAVELRESEHMPVGFLARALGASDRTVMRITDAGRRTADGALCATARLCAQALKQQGDVTAAARILHEALDASRDDDDSITGERALAFLELSHIETDREAAIRLLRRGLRQAPRIQVEQLGATFDEIARFDPLEIASQMQQIAAINLGLVADGAALDNTVRVVPSPIWERSGGELGCRAQLGMTMVPGPCLRLFWSGVTRTEIESGLVAQIAGHVFAALARREEGVARMAYVVRETRQTFAVSGDAPRALAAPGEVDPHMFLASAVLAHVARQRTAGLTEPEIDAAFGLNHDPEDRQLAHDKGRRLRVRLAQWTRNGRT